VHEFDFKSTQERQEIKLRLMEETLGKRTEK